MNKTIEKKLDRFLFPVGERAVFVDDDKTYKPTKHYKAIVREDNGKLVSIMKDSYQLVSNYTGVNAVTGGPYTDIDSLDEKLSGGRKLIHSKWGAYYPPRYF